MLRAACAYAQSDQSHCYSLENSMSVKLLTEQHLEFLSLKGGCTGSSESARVKMPHCWKSHVTANLLLQFDKVFLHRGPNMSLSPPPLCVCVVGGGGGRDRTIMKFIHIKFWPSGRVVDCNISILF